MLDIAQDGVAFPAWAEKFGWEATGTHTGEIDGRAATTVYYEKDGKTLAYTIVGGDALDVPDDTTTINAEGTPVDDLPGGRHARRHVGARRPHVRAHRRRRRRTPSSPSSPAGRPRARSRSRPIRRAPQPYASTTRLRAR